MDDDLGIHELVTVIAEVDLVVTIGRVGRVAAVDRGTQILFESRQQDLGGLDAAADHRAAVEHEHRVARFCEISTGQETIVTGPSDDVVELLAGGLSELLSLPGCWHQRERRKRGRVLYKFSPSGRGHRGLLFRQRLAVVCGHFDEIIRCRGNYMSRGYLQASAIPRNPFHHGKHHSLGTSGSGGPGSTITTPYHPATIG